MIAQQIICRSLFIFCAAWISSGEPQTKGKISNDILKGRSQQGTPAVLGAVEAVQGSEALVSYYRYKYHFFPGTGFQEQCEGNCRARGRDCTEPCDSPYHGNKTFVCPRGWWQKSTETCSSLNVQSLLQRISMPRFELRPYSTHNSPSGGLGAREGQSCIADFSCITGEVLSAKPVPGNIVKIVTLLQNISSSVSTDVTIGKLKDYSKMANHILDGTVLPDWTYVSDKNASSILLESVNSFAGKFQIGTDSPDVSDLFIATKGARIGRNAPEKNFTFSLRFNNSTSRLNGTVSLPREGLQRLPADSQVMTVAMPTAGPIIEKTLLEGQSVNGMVLSVMLPEALEKVSLLFEKMNKTMSAVCVAWHAAHRRWDDTACELEKESSDTVTCRCLHQPSRFQSFSILMSPVSVKHPSLHFITCVGLVVSICSLVLCLAVEAAVWRLVTQTDLSYMRHVCLVNIAASLLVADVLFIVAAFANGTPRNYSGCVAATFFMHFFYLALFCWMLALGLLILYGLLVIFWQLRKSNLLAAAFGTGYGCPAVITLLTVMITEPKNGYLRNDACWLNWSETRALLAFIIPALFVIGFNVIVLLVVIARSGRPAVGDRSKAQDLGTVIRVSKNLVLLTPLLGLTWGFGLATVQDSSLVFHVLFSLFNAFQGFFILLFGTLLDRKTREGLRIKCFSAKSSSSEAEL